MLLPSLNGPEFLLFSWDAWARQAARLHSSASASCSMRAWLQPYSELVPLAAMSPLMGCLTQFWRLFALCCQTSNPAAENASLFPICLQQ